MKNKIEYIWHQPEFDSWETRSLYFSEKVYEKVSPDPYNIERGANLFAMIYFVPETCNEVLVHMFRWVTWAQNN